MGAVSDILLEARRLLNDEDTTRQAFPDAELLQYVTEGIREVIRVAPKWSQTTTLSFTASGGAEQNLAPSAASAVIDILSLTDSSGVSHALRQVPREAMDAFRPGWRSDTNATPEEWMHEPSDPLKFYLYPPAFGGEVLDLRVVPTVTDKTSADSTGLADIFDPILTDYVVYRASSKDDEHVDSKRAVAFFETFVAKVKQMSGS